MAGRIIKTKSAEDGDKLARILSELEDFLAYWWGDKQAAVQYVDGIEVDILEHDEDVISIAHQEAWIDRHSVNCYFCGELVDERDCSPANAYNNNDGGSICPKCLGEKERGE